MENTEKNDANESGEKRKLSEDTLEIEKDSKRLCSDADIGDKNVDTTVSSLSSENKEIESATSTVENVETKISNVVDSTSEIESNVNDPSTTEGSANLEPESGNLTNEATTLIQNDATESEVISKDVNLLTKSEIDSTQTSEITSSSNDLIESVNEDEKNIENEECDTVSEEHDKSKNKADKLALNSITDGVDKLASKPESDEVDSSPTDSVNDEVNKFATKPVNDKVDGLASDSVSDEVDKLTSDSITDEVDKLTSKPEKSDKIDSLASESVSDEVDKMATESLIKEVDKLPAESVNPLASDEIENITSESISDEVDKATESVTDEVHKLTSDVVSDEIDKATETVSDEVDKLADKSVSGEVDKLATESVSDEVDKLADKSVSGEVDKLADKSVSGEVDKLATETVSEVEKMASDTVVDKVNSEPISDGVDELVSEPVCDKNDDSAIEQICNESGSTTLPVNNKIDESICKPDSSDDKLSSEAVSDEIGKSASDVLSVDDNSVSDPVCNEDDKISAESESNEVIKSVDLKDNSSLEESKSNVDELAIKETLQKVLCDQEDNATDAVIVKENSESVTTGDTPSFQSFSETLKKNSRAEQIEDVTNTEKKFEMCPDIDSTVCSNVETPCDSRDISPTSTPLDSGQVSAVPSPIQKEDSTMGFDESSMDTQDVPESGEKEKDKGRNTRSKVKSNLSRKKGKRGRSTPVIMDEDTRMSASGAMDEDSQSSVSTTSRRESKKYRMEVINPASTEAFNADKVIEYIWPLEGVGEHYFVQEHISQYLGIISFKRRYPNMRRRKIEGHEKEYLKDLMNVTEITCDLGLTAVRSEDVFDIMFTDYPAKYEELQKSLRETKERQLKEKGKVEYQTLDLDKSKMQEYSRKAALNAARWNAAFNKERNEDRKHFFDLETFTVHSPQSRFRKIPTKLTKVGSYPVAVLPGQYIDNCKTYTYNELRSMPLHTVHLGPYTAEEIAAGLQGPDEVESDEESAPERLETCPEVKEEVNGSAVTVTDPMSAEKQLRCKVCNGGKARNKAGKPEPLVICGSCRTASHPTCIDLTGVIFEKLESYSWQCMDCKTCVQCKDPDDEEKMIFCDMCDRGYHIYCVGLRRVPNGRWHCKVCAECSSCGSRNPAGSENIKNAEWQHEFRKEKLKKELKYVTTLCMPCDKYWKRRQFCGFCLKVYRSIPEDGMVKCTACPRYVHKDKCSVQFEGERYCNTCYKNRNKTALNHSRIIAAAKKKMANDIGIWRK